MTDTPPLLPTPILETERLILRPLRLEDAAAIQEGFDDWEVIRHLNGAVPWPYPADGALTHVRLTLTKREKGEHLCWVLTMKDGDDRAIGRIDLWPDDGVRRDMRGFWLARAYWGRGLMTEAAEGVTAYAFEVLGWPHLLLGNAKDNVGSRRVKEKQGAILVDETPFDFASGPGIRQDWRLDRDAWLARRKF